MQKIKNVLQFNCFIHTLGKLQSKYRKHQFDLFIEPLLANLKWVSSNTVPSFLYRVLALRDMLRNITVFFQIQSSFYQPQFGKDYKLIDATFQKDLQLEIEIFQQLRLFLQNSPLGLN